MPFFHSTSLVSLFLFPGLSPTNPALGEVRNFVFKRGETEIQGREKGNIYIKVDHIIFILKIFHLQKV